MNKGQRNNEMHKLNYNKRNFKWLRNKNKGRTGIYGHNTSYNIRNISYFGTYQVLESVYFVYIYFLEIINQ